MKGLNDIRLVFGDEWLEEAVKVRHPIASSYLLNLAPWTRFWLLAFSEKLVMLSRESNFEKLRRKLMNGKTYAEGFAELDVMAKIKKAGFSMELYPTENGKEVDLKVMLDGQEYFIEVTLMRPSEESRKASRTFNQLTYPFFSFQDVAINCKIHKLLSAPHIQELQERIK